MIAKTDTSVRNGVYFMQIQGIIESLLSAKEPNHYANKQDSRHCNRNGVLLVMALFFVLRLVRSDFCSRYGSDWCVFRIHARASVNKV
jgi:hypothetical protein